MPDFDVRKSLHNGLKFRRIFIDIMIYSVSVFIAFYWNSLFTEIINAFLPSGTNLLQKVAIGMSVTFFMVCGCFLMIKWEIHKDNLYNQRKTK